MRASEVEVLCACADSCAKDAEIERLRAALGTIRSLAYSEAPAEDLEDAQNDLRNIYATAVAALGNQQGVPEK